MNLRAVSIYIGRILIVQSLLMVPALMIAAALFETRATIGFSIAMFAQLLIALPLTKRKRRQHEAIYASEGFAIAALTWIVVSLFTMFVYFISGEFGGLMNCWFESVSGYTTTGATILTNVEALPKSILYWRSFTLWIGGMGVLAFMLAIVPTNERGSGEAMHFMRAESPGPSMGKLTPKLKSTAKLLYIIYFALTLATFLLLLLGGMPVFDSLTNALAIAATGGFSIKNAGLSAYPGAYFQVVLGLTMFLSAISFTIYYLLIKKQFRYVSKNEELRTYLIMIVAFTIIVTINISNLYADGFSAFKDALFHVISMISTTCVHTVDYALWPELSKLLLLLLFAAGGCAGSTAGGFKLSRLILLFKYLKAQLQTMLRPRAIKPVRMNGKTVDDSMLKATFAYLTAYVAILVISMILVSPDNLNIEETLTSVLASLSNAGPGYGIIGPGGNYSSLSLLSKAVLTLDMLLGRLEIFPVLLILSPAMWRKRA
ncbi:TrkH family potassium uptake protein [Eubacteriales bacterium OttesenSCG-928-K08]|nr:TrkH family potassium uptake protein [Eubacteriales bacterium OttesenSCG-928-K08]